MYSRQCFFITALLTLVLTSSALAQSEPLAPHYTLQVASFPDTELANKFVVQLVREGEHPTRATIELQGRGYWTRVFLGLFASAEEARRYGENLKARGIIAEFLIRKAELNQAVTRPRRVAATGTGGSNTATESADPSGANNNRAIEVPILSKFDIYDDATMRMRLKGKSEVGSGECPGPVKRPESVLPILAAKHITLAPAIDRALIPRPDAVALAFKLIVEANSAGSTPGKRSGLWLSGDTAEGMSRLRWIAGDENARMISLGEDGRVRLDRAMLAKAAGACGLRVTDPLKVADYILSNEGLLLLVQLFEGSHRYLLHIGNQVPTHGRTIEIAGGINLDNNFDSRINPYRKHGKKLDEERPPEGFAALIGLNPVAQWFNLSTRGWVQVGEITLHELAEAYGKVELGLDYLEQGANPGAHSLAVERERRLKSQRPDEDIVLTAGSNRVLRTQQEIRLFYAESVGDVGKQ